MIVALIAAVTRNGVIGHDQQLVWRDPQDARHFRDTTMGFPVVMGRKTWESVPPKYRPLPGRHNIVVTRNPAWHADGASRTASLHEALALALAHGASKVFVLGGGELYAQALPLVDELVLTEVAIDLPGDTRFVKWDSAQFSETSRVEHTDAHGTPFAFVTYQRRPGAKADAPSHSS